MSVNLTQTEAAGFPDRPPDALGTGLQISCEVGDEGAYLAHDLGVEHAVLHMRVALHADAAAGGAVYLAGGNDAQHEPVWWVDYNSDTRGLKVMLADGSELAATLNALPWQVIEVKVDTVAGEVELRVNGVVTAATSGSFVQLAARHVWLGAVFKEPGLAGELYLDEWCVANEPIGPIVTPPTSAYADDPARWLVIYNTADADAVNWVAAYREARQMPYANLLGLDLPLSEVINESQFDALIDAIDDYLNHAGLGSQIIGILCGYRVPGYVDYEIATAIEPVPALLHYLVSWRGTRSNDLANDAMPSRPTRNALGEHYLTARIDGANVDVATGLVQRATTLMENGLGDGQEATLWFDPFTGLGGVLASYRQRMLDWVQSVDRMRTRLPLVLSGDVNQPEADADFRQIQQDGFLWSWSTSHAQGPPEGLFSEPPGVRVVSVQVRPQAPTAPTLRSGSAENWIQAPVEAGYAAAVASSSAYVPEAIPYARPFFEALRRGWTLAEAWYLAMPILRDGLYLVGDPLLYVAFPHAGWDVYGPLDRLESLDPEAPSQALRESEKKLVLPDTMKPAEGAQSFYLVRRVDAKGRHEASVSVCRMMNEQGAARPALLPVWPDHSPWPVSIENGVLVLTALWERPLSVCHIAKIELRGEVDGEAEATLLELPFELRDRLVQATLPLPETQGRYRWCVVSLDGVASETVWSQTVQPRSAVDVALHVLEVQP